MGNATPVLDELDIKCINELPFLVEIIASAGNKLARIFNPLYEDLLNEVKKNIPKRWELYKDTAANYIYPFYNPEAETQATTFSEDFEIDNYITLFIKGEKGGWLDWFYIHFGFRYTKDEGQPFYYYQILKYLPKRSAGCIHPLEFYNEREKVLAAYNLKILHPDKGDKEELFRISHSEHSAEKIKAAYEVYKRELVIPFLKGISKKKSL